MTAGIHELYNGVAVIIDDEIHDDTANVKHIINQISSVNMPYLAYSELPSDAMIRHFHSLSFLVLDWRLATSKYNEDGIRLPDSLTNGDQNIAFIRSVMVHTYCPIFIFTNENVTDVINILKSEQLYSNEFQSNIFVSSKADITPKGKMFRAISYWIKNNPSIYVLKEWDKEYSRAKLKMFREMTEINPSWPRIMWKTFHEDGLNKSYELGELISRNLLNRMIPFEFSNSILNNHKKYTNKEILNVLRGERYLSNEALHDDTIQPGDVFKSKGESYINIRASCDLIPRNKSDGLSIELYLLKGQKINPKKLSKKYNRQYGHFEDRENAMIIYPICDDLAIEFSFKKIFIEKWTDFKDKRVGRVLPPFINRLQQRYAYYLHRHGIPRFPKSAIPK